MMRKNEMSERILDIRKTDENIQEGYIICTNKQEICLLMDVAPQCCEIFGYFWVNDDIKRFIGSTLYGIRLVDADNRVRELVSRDIRDVYDKYTSIAFIKLDTSEGELEFVAYNSHNGYYGHDVIIKSKQLNAEITI